MQKQSDKTIEEKRLEAQMALEGDARKQARKEAKEKRLAEEERRKEEEEHLKQETERKKREEEEKKKLEEKQKKEEEENRKREEEVRKKEAEEKKKQEEAEVAAKKEALLKKMRPPGSTPQPATKKDLSTDVGKVIQRVPAKSGSVKKSKIPQIRTYKSDIAETIKKQGESLVKIAVAEKKEARKKDKVQKTQTHKKATIKVLIATLGLFVVVTFGGVLIYQLNKKGVFSSIFDNLKNTPDKNITESTPAVIMPSLIKASTEKKIILPEESEDMLDIIAKELRETSGSDSIKNIYLLETSTITTGEGKRIVQSVANVKKLLSAWKQNMPDMLSRSLSRDFMLGIYSSSPGTNTPFLIFKTNSHEQTFAGMFAWENTLPFDFYNLFGLETMESYGTFRDSIVDGKDVRVLESVGGKTILIYSFPDENTAVITTNEATFIKILSGLSK
jgi:hypothetical protein